MTKEIVFIRCLFPWNILISGPAGRRDRPFSRHAIDIDGTHLGRCTSLRPHAQLPPDTVKVVSGC